ncbi:MAG: xanthine dehydrogenase family protein subunit M [Burkholderiaceae bacterium]|nr:xanthine dehydrogenase family protein subunit M [Burkholderiaceae bacterium]
MNSFSFQRATTFDDAIRLGQQPGARFIGGGTNLVDLMKGGIEQPMHLIDVSSLPMSGIAETKDGGIRIGAAARNSDVADHALVRARYPLLCQALLAGASPQLRNMATVGGNLMQRTRCYYFTDASFEMCNKRNPGSGCAALHGINRIHAILGTSEQCIAVNPSDMNVALAALEAEVHVRGPRGARTIPFGTFHRLPGNTPQNDTTLAPGELIVAVTLPPSPFATHAHYLKVRDRASYAFALVSVAAALDMQNGVVKRARIALGGVAHKPWRADAAEAALVGRSLDAQAIRDASRAAVVNARPYEHNGFKVELTARAVGRALSIAGEQA